jgi:hypothetical protein
MMISKESRWKKYIGKNRSNKGWKHTTCPSKIVITWVFFFQLLFLMIYGHHIFEISCFKYIWLTLDLSSQLFFKIQKNWRTYGIYLWQISAYITKFEKMHIYFKTMVLVVNFWWFFNMMNDIDVHQYFHSNYKLFDTWLGTLTYITMDTFGLQV